MAFEETREQQQMYNYFRSCIYIFLIIEIVMNLPITADNRVTQFILDLLGRFKVFNSVSGCKVAELICICVVCIGTKAKKALKFNVKTMVIYPVLAELTLVGMCFIFHGMNIGMSWFGFPANRILYALCSVVGTMLVHQGLDGIAKYYNYKVGEDRFNFENESFQQSEDLVANDYSVNIPMIYYWKQKMHKGWINIINPFRGTIVLGTPGSGKSVGIIDPFIRQHAAKGFAIMCYDFKFPTLATTLFYQYCKNGFPANRILYALCSVVGTMLVHQGLDGIAKYYNYKVGEDRFNFENESFQQSEDLVANDYSVNIPMIYYWKQKMHKGWINIINPFRGTIVLGTPGSGKSVGIIDPFIRQHAAKGFAIMCYDFKFPTLATTLFYQYCKNRKLKKLPEKCGFRVVYFTDVEYSSRINPWSIRDWTASPKTITTRWVKTATTSRTNRSSSRKLW